MKVRVFLFFGTDSLRHPTAVLLQRFSPAKAYRNPSSPRHLTQKKCCRLPPRNPRVTTAKQLKTPHNVPFQPLFPAHRPHILFCGSSVVQLQQGERAARGKMFSPPFGGGVGLVLRTGFCTQKGELLRSISCSGDSVSVNNKEALAFMGVLLVFAVAASSYVLNHSWSSGKTTHFKLLMRCIMIITTVSPLQLQLFFCVVDAGPGHPS
jgi:magnesium-transporting ATPase (P-type)